MPRAFETTWNPTNIQAALQRFVNEQGRLPTGREMDQIDYLPTSRTIQRRFGGLERFRSQFGFPIVHFGKGQNRSNLATRANQRGQEAEAVIKFLLQEKFGEMFVHIERPFGLSSKQRLDFYVFSPSGNFGVDVFYPEDIYSMASSINVKQRTYKNYADKLYLVVAAEIITQEDINKVAINKINKLATNYLILTTELFKTHISEMGNYNTLTAGE